MIFTIENFFFDTPIYTKIKIDNTNINEFNKLEKFGTTIEGYNPKRKVQSTFVLSKTLTYSDNNIRANGGLAKLGINCKRYGDEFEYYILWDPHSQFLMKVGQYPSVAEFHIYEVKKYKKLLSDEKLKEFTRAIGLAANGAGIGSFVYLRRIFEDLISEAYTQALKDSFVSQLEYQKARMEEKIQILSTYLPAFLVENRGLYSILSKGIHELDENTCLAHFDTLKVGIEIILDEKLEYLLKKEKIESAAKKLAELQSKISSATNPK